MNLDQQILKFYSNLGIPAVVPEGVEVMDPYRGHSIQKTLRAFYSEYFADDLPRVILIGINPGRFGGGITGIPFTDPINLEKVCGIPNDFDKRHELSSRFVYEMIQSLGGVEIFYRSFYITAASPLGFTKDGKNLNYYDIPELMTNWKSFMIKSLKDQINMCKNRTICFSLGQGKNFKILNKWNEEFGMFDEIRALPHPRWIMQYRLKRKEEFIQVYGKALGTYLS